VLGVSIRNGCLAGVSPLIELKIDGQLVLGTTHHALSCADDYRQRADECRRNAAQVADDALRGAYLDLARRWRNMAQQAQQNELGSTDTAPLSRASRQATQAVTLSVAGVIFAMLMWNVMMLLFY
jgi:hypothetical protein